MTRRRLTMERIFAATIDEVWELWTTKAGVESWWGPDGFEVTVHEIDLRPGGQMRYAMAAVEPAHVAFMKQQAMPTVTEARLTYTEIAPKRRIAYVHLADFVPGVEPYDVATVVELQATAGGVRMVLTFDAMHDERWTEMAQKGWESQLDRAARVLSARHPG
jgi:uncharacterized protein YndB with AHSA1/START domain